MKIFIKERKFINEAPQTNVSISNYQEYVNKFAQLFAEIMDSNQNGLSPIELLKSADKIKQSDPTKAINFINKACTTYDFFMMMMLISYQDGVDQVVKNASSGLNAQLMGNLQFFRNLPTIFSKIETSRFDKTVDMPLKSERILNLQKRYQSKYGGAISEMGLFSNNLLRINEDPMKYINTADLQQQNIKGQSQLILSEVITKLKEAIDDDKRKLLQKLTGKDASTFVPRVRGENPAALQKNVAAVRITAPEPKPTAPAPVGQPVAQNRITR